MSCLKLRKSLYLYAGGDLPEKKAKAITHHLEGCPDCQSFLENIQRSREAARMVARIDRPDPLPADFSDKTAQAVKEEAEILTKPISGIRKSFQLKPILAVGTAVCGIMIVLAFVFDFFGPNSISPEKFLKEIQQMPGRQGIEVKWDSKNILSRTFSRPVKLKDWDAPGDAGVFTIMRKTRESAGKDSFVIDFCGQGRKLSLYKSYPWIQHRKKKLISLAGSLDDIYIAVFLMPGSTGLDRQKIKNALIENFNPDLNKGV